MEVKKWCPELLSDLRQLEFWRNASKSVCGIALVMVGNMGGNPYFFMMYLFCCSGMSSGLTRFILAFIQCFCSFLRWASLRSWTTHMGSGGRGRREFHSQPFTHRDETPAITLGYVWVESKSGQFLAKMPYYSPRFFADFGPILGVAIEGFRRQMEAWISLPTFLP